MSKPINETIKKYFQLVKENNDNPCLTKQIENTINNYDEEYRQKLINIVKSTDSTELEQIYSEALADGSLISDAAIPYALSENDNLPESIVNELCFVGIPDKHFYPALFKHHFNDLSDATFEEIYSEHPFSVMSAVTSVRYQNSVTKQDLKYPEKIMNAVALHEFNDFTPSTYSYQTAPIIFRYITDEKFLDNIVDKVRNTSENKELVITEILNNPFINDTKKDEIFDEFGCDFKNVLLPTPHMVDTMYRSVVETVFQSDIDRSGKNKEELNAYWSATKVLDSMVSHGLLTSGMEYDLMKMLIDRKERSSDMLTYNLVRTTKNPSVLHIALQLKSTNDKDAAIQNPHLSKEDIVVVAKNSAKNINTSLKKRTYPSVKHIRRLEDLSTKATLPDDVYETLLKADIRTGAALATSPYTPIHILQKTLSQAMDEKYSTCVSQEFNSRCMIYSIEHSLSREKMKDLLKAISYASTFANECRKSNFITYSHSKCYSFIKSFTEDNSEIEQYIKCISELPKTAIAELYRNAIPFVLERIKNPNLIVEDEEISPSDYTDIVLDATINRLASLEMGTTGAGRLNFYINLEDKATEYLKLYEEKITRESFKKLEEAIEEK